MESDKRPISEHETPVDVVYDEWIQERENKNTKKAYGEAISHFLRYLESGDMYVLSTTDTTSIQNYFDDMASTGKSGQTISNRLNILRSFYSRLQLKGIRKDNPTSSIKKPKSQPSPTRQLTTEEVKQLLEQLEENVAGLQSSQNEQMKLALRDRTIINFLIFTGLNLSDVISLKISDWLKDSNLIRRKDKKGNYRKLILTQNLSKLINEYVEIAGQKENTASHLFLPSRIRQASKKENPSMTLSTTRHMITNRAKAAGLENVSSQVLRRTFVFLAQQTNATASEIRYSMGYNKPSDSTYFISAFPNTVSINKKIETLLNFDLFNKK